MYSFAETSAPLPYTADQLLGNVSGSGSSAASPQTVTEIDTAADQTKTSKVTTTQAAVSPSSPSPGLSGLISGLSLSKQIAISAILQGDAPPNYAKIAPNVSVMATPMSSLSGSSADLVLHTTFGVPAPDPLDRSTPDIFQKQHASGIESDDVSTRVDVDGFTLFHISSATFRTVVPQGNGGIPVLDRLPLVGPLFQWGRAPANTEHQSLLVVSAVIVPRALHLANFFGATSARNHAEEKTGPDNSPLFDLRGLGQ